MAPFYAVKYLIQRAFEQVLFRTTVLFLLTLMLVLDPYCVLLTSDTLTIHTCSRCIFCPKL